MGRRVGWPGFAYLALIYAFLYFPAVLVVVFSFNRSRVWAFPLKGFALRWYEELAARPDALNAAKNSLIVALPTTVLSVLIGVAVAFALHHWGSRLKGVMDGALLLPLLIPHLIWAVALLLFLTAFAIPTGAATVILGHVLLTTPYVVLLVNARFHSLDPSLEDAARGLGAGSRVIVVRIILPHLAPALLAGGLITFAISFSELVVAYFLTGGGFDTLPVFIYSLIQLEPSPVINAVASVIFGVAVLAILAAMVIGGRDALLVGKRERDARAE